MKILVIDGQGGNIGKELIKMLKASLPKSQITAVGTNFAATAAMRKVGADNAATGENPVIVASRKADVIVGPIAIVIADSLLGEITPAMATAVAQSEAIRILLPMNRCDNIVAGIVGQTLDDILNDAVKKIALLESNCSHEG